MCYPICGMVHIKEPLLLINKSSLCGGSGFPFSLSEWSLTICLTPYNRKISVSVASAFLLLLMSSVPRIFIVVLLLCFDGISVFLVVLILDDLCYCIGSVCLVVLMLEASLSVYTVAPMLVVRILLPNSNNVRGTDDFLYFSI